MVTYHKNVYQLHNFCISKKEAVSKMHLYSRKEYFFYSYTCTKYTFNYVILDLFYLDQYWLPLFFVSNANNLKKNDILSIVLITTLKISHFFFEIVYFGKQIKQ